MTQNATTRTAVAAILAGLLPAALIAQPEPPVRPPRDETLLGIAGIGGAPTGTFGEVVGAGWGLAGSVAWRPGSLPVGLRGEASFLGYASESWEIPVPGTGGRITDELTTSNWIGRFAAGPQVTFGHGSVRPYVYATAGASCFATTTTLRRDDDCGGCGDDWASDTNYSDWTFSWSAGGGLLLRLGRAGFLDVGARYVGNGTVDWLAEGDLVDGGAGPAQPRPRRSEANVVEVTLGFVFGL